jgi:2-polyprenyl-6-methoxyphenol hydroxylase-like FAD-dependent oxidoreductase
MKRHDPSHDIVVYERGPRDATWGFGVVFSDRALEFLRADDEDLVRLLTPHMETWPDLTIVHNDTRIPIAGNGFAAIGRLEMLGLLYAHAESLGVRIVFQTEISSLSRPELAGADLVVAANGAFSWVRAENEPSFGTRSTGGRTASSGTGRAKPFDSLSLTFRETPHGVFCAHHYRYRPDMSTFLVEVEHADLAARRASGR